MNTLKGSLILVR